jgi:type I restriction enzyme S subunit
MVEQVSSLKTNVKCKNTPIGRIPVDWEVVRLGDICEVVKGNTLSRKNKEYSGGVVPSTIPKDTTGSQNNVISEEKLRCNERADNLFVLYEVRSVQHGLDKQKNSIVSKKRSKKDICSLLLPLPPISEQKGITDILSTVDQAIEKTKEIIEKTKALHRVLAPIQEQRKITLILSCIDSEIEQEVNYGERLELLKKGLMQQLLTGKIRVPRA